jgi:hypothetical protein
MSLTLWTAVCGAIPKPEEKAFRENLKTNSKKTKQ